MGRAARERVMNGHTAAHRAAELEGYIVEATDGAASRTPLSEREAQPAEAR
jgi:hypothetical protein